MSTIYFLFFIISGLLLICYPMVLIANIMSFAGHKSEHKPPLFMVIAMQSFLWSTTLYPITYLFALYKYKNTPPETHYIWAGLILLHLCFIFLAFIGWTTIGEKSSKNKHISPLIILKGESLLKK